MGEALRRGGASLRPSASSLRALTAALLLPVLVLLAAGCSLWPGAGADTLVIYSGRGEPLVDPLFRAFAAETGIRVQVRYGSTSELAITLLEEGERSGADLFFAQDAGALGAVEAAGLFRPLPEDILTQVEPRFRSAGDRWVGITGRARVVVYNTERVRAADLPDSILDYTDPEWQNRIGWPPTNGSFQAFVTALRVTLGAEAARDWLAGIIANAPREYPNNAQTVEAVAAGEVDVGFVNHYYLYRLRQEHGAGFAAENHFLTGGDVGGLINVAGIGILASSEKSEAAEAFIRFLLSATGQSYFVEATFEYPLATGTAAPAMLPPLESIETPVIDLGSLADLDGTLRLLDDAGAL